MLRRFAFALLAVVFAAGLATADEAKKDVKKAETKAAAQKATGTIKSVGTNDFVVTDANGKDLTFAVDKDTFVYAKGASHKMDALKADGKPAQISEFLQAKQNVSVEYADKDGTMVAKEVRVKK